MIIKTQIKKAEDIFHLEEKPHQCDLFSDVRYNELIPILIDLYKEEIISSVNLTPYTVINTAMEFSSLTLEPQKQEGEVLKKILNELSIQEQEEYTDPIWMAKREKYRYNPTNIEEHATVLGAIYYISCFNPDFYKKKALLNLCKSEINSDTGQNIFNRFKNKADAIIKVYKKAHQTELKKAGLTTIGHYWLPDISSLYEYDNIEKELESIDKMGNTSKEGKTPDNKKEGRLTASQYCIFFYYLFDQSGINFSNSDMTEWSRIISKLTLYSSDRIYTVLKKLKKDLGEGKQTKKDSKLIADLIRPLFPNISDKIEKNSN